MRASANDYLNILQQLLPTGAAWPREADATLTKALAAWAEEFARAHNRAVDLIDIEADPRLATELLPEWETMVGTDPCSQYVPDTLPARREAVVSKLTARGGQSRAFYREMARGLGFDPVTITEFRPFTVDSECVDPICDEPWRFAWQVEAPGAQDRELTCQDHCQTPLAYQVGLEVLQCALGRTKPAHTVVIVKGASDA